MPQIETESSISICLGTGKTLSATGATSYTWSPIDGLDNANIATPIANPTSTSTYIVRGTDEQGCIGTTEVTVEVQNLPEISIGKIKLYVMEKH